MQSFLFFLCPFLACGSRRPVSVCEYRRETVVQAETSIRLPREQRFWACGGAVLGSVSLQQLSASSVYFFNQENEHLKKFQVTWELHNKHLFENLVFSEPLLQSNLPALVSQIRYCLLLHAPLSVSMPFSCGVSCVPPEAVQPGRPCREATGCGECRGGSAPQRRPAERFPARSWRPLSPRHLPQVPVFLRRGVTSSMSA